MNKLTALIEAAKAALVPDTDADMCRKGYVPNMLAYYKKADPATILELCTLLETAEEALDKYRGQVDRFGEHTSVEALAAIKQWKELK